MDEQSLFLTALEHRDPSARTAYLDRECGDNSALRQRIAELLQKHDDLGSFLERPPLELLGAATTGDRFTSRPSVADITSFLTPTDKPGVLGLLGNYEVLNVIGRGGMGVVLRALDPKLNRVVAVKVLAPELAANPNARRRFLREAQAAAAVSHPHVVTIHAVEEGQPTTDEQTSAQWPFLVMECIVGQSLQEKLDKVGSLGVTEILRIGQQIASGLAAAHKQGLIHRDIKPANILLENGVERVKITDFGLARLVDDVTITRTGEVSGTPQYMSPEQAAGERVDHRSDLFSLGCVLYAMCTGHSPFRGDSIAHVIKRVTQDTPRPIEELNPEIPRWLVEIINRLLEKPPERRFQAAAELSELLGSHLARQQHAAPGGVSHSGINVRYLPPVQRQPEPSPWRHPIGSSAPSASRLIPVPWFWRLFGGVLLVSGGGLFAVKLLLALILYLNPNSWAGRMGNYEDHLFQALLGLYPAVVGGLLTKRWMTSHMMLGILFCTLGPLGLAVWLIRHEAWETEAVDAGRARAMDQHRRSAHSEFDAVVRNVALTAVVATVLAIGVSLLLPVPDVVDFTSKVLGGAAIGWLVVLMIKPFVPDRLGGGRMLLQVGPPLWTLACIPLLTMIAYDAVVVGSSRESYAGLLIMIAAAWLLPLAAMLYFLRRGEPATDAAPQMSADSSSTSPPTRVRRTQLFVSVAIALASMIVMLLINDQGRLPSVVGLAEVAVVLLMASLVLALPAIAFWWLVRRLRGAPGNPAQQSDPATGTPGTGWGWPAIGGLSMFPLFLGSYWFVSQGSMRFTLANIAEALLLLATIGIVLGGALAFIATRLNLAPTDTGTGWDRLRALLGQPGQPRVQLAVAALLLATAIPVAAYVVMKLPDWRMAVRNRHTVPVVVDYDPAFPIHSIYDTNHRREFVSDKRPFPLSLTPGIHNLTVRYEARGQKYEFFKSVNVAGEPSGPPIALDFSSDIARHRDDLSRKSNVAAPTTSVVDAQTPPIMPDVWVTMPAEPSTPATPETAITRTSPTHPPSVVWSTAPEHRPTTVSNGMQVRVLSEGLVLALRKKSLFDGGIDKTETLVSEFGDSYPKLDRGEYEWLLRDLQYGWVADRRGTVTILDPLKGALVVQRNLAEAILPRVNPRRGYDQTSRFRWNGDEYTLDSWQAQAVQRLAQATIDGQPDMTEAELIAAIDQSVSYNGRLTSQQVDAESGYMGGPPTLDRLTDLLGPQTKPHPAWGTLIVAGATPDTFRLASPEQGRLEFDLTADVKSVKVHSKTGTLIYTTPGHRTLTLPAGEYRCEFVPAHPDVAWISRLDLVHPNTRTVQVPVGGAVKLDLTHTLQ